MLYGRLAFKTIPFSYPIFGRVTCSLIVGSVVWFYGIRCFRFLLLGYTRPSIVNICEIEDETSCEDVLDDMINNIIPFSSVKPDTTGRTNFRAHVLRVLRETCHIDDFKNVPGDRRILKKKVVTIMRTEHPDIRDIELYQHGDIIVEMFFVPTRQDIECRSIRYAPNVLEIQRVYDRPIWIGSFTRALLGLPLWVDPRGPPS